MLMEPANEKFPAPSSTYCPSGQLAIAEFTVEMLVPAGMTAPHRVVLLVIVAPAVAHAAFGTDALPSGKRLDEMGFGPDEGGGAGGGIVPASLVMWSPVGAEGAVCAISIAERPAVTKTTAK